MRSSKKHNKDISVLRHLVPYLRPYWRQMLLATIALVIAAGTVLGLGQGLKTLIDQGFKTGNEVLLNQSLLVLIAVVCVLAVASFTRYYLVSWIGERLVADLRKDVYSHLIFLDPYFFESNKTGEVISRITADTTVLQSVIGSSVSLALRNSLLLVGGLVMLMVTSPKLTGLVLLVVPLVIFPIIYFGRKVRTLSKAAQDKVAEVSSFVDESLHAIRTVQAFVQEKNSIRAYNHGVEEANKVAVGYIGARARLSAFVIFVVFSAVCVILWLGGRDVLTGALSAGQLSAFIFYAVVVAGAVGVISEVAGNIQRAVGATESLFALLRERGQITSPESPVIFPAQVEGRIEFKDVCFHYPSRPETRALDNVTFCIEQGTTIAIVGPSGSGKTTILSLLLRFYDVQSGMITLDGIDICSVRLDDLRRHFGTVPQDPFIFSGSVEENIRFAKPDASFEEVEQAAKRAYADEFIAKMPEGYQTKLGENGIRLSGGQKQRVAIARAILKDPAILLLDEATSSLDSESEDIVQKAMTELMEGRTTIVIAHRLATIRNADNIIVLNQGAICEQGTHDALIKQNGLYKKLADMQFLEDKAA